MSNDDDIPDGFNLPSNILGALGLPQLPREKPPLVIPDSPSGDYEQARKNIYEALHKAEQLLDIAMNVTESSQHPRSIEVTTGVINQILEGNKGILELAKKQQELLSKGQESPSTINNTLVVTSSELLDRMKALKKKE